MLITLPFAPRIPIAIPCVQPTPSHMYMLHHATHALSLAQPIQSSHCNHCTLTSVSPAGPTFIPPKAVGSGNLGISGTGGTLLSKGSIC